MSLDCAVCFEEHLPHNITSVYGSFVCHDCVRHMFEQAIQCEENYPPQWGGKKLRTKEYSSILPQKLQEKLREKEKEYLTAPDDRVYCTFVNPDVMIDVGDEEVPCGHFVGRIDEDWARKVEASIISHGCCRACDTLYCMNCGEQYRLRHACTKPGPRNNDQSFEGLVKGKHYQTCPSSTCRRKIELRDGCNHVRCRCGMMFCFICGEQARSSHFNKPKEEGGCPRFGHPGRPNAIFEGGNDLFEGFEARMVEFHELGARLGHRRNAVFGFPMVEGEVRNFRNRVRVVVTEAANREEQRDANRLGRMIDVGAAENRPHREILWAGDRPNAAQTPGIVRRPFNPRAEAERTTIAANFQDPQVHHAFNRSEESYVRAERTENMGSNTGEEPIRRRQTRGNDRGRTLSEVLERLEARRETAGEDQGTRQPLDQTLTGPTQRRQQARGRNFRDTNPPQFEPTVLRPDLVEEASAARYSMEALVEQARRERSELRAALNEFPAEHDINPMPTITTSHQAHGAHRAGNEARVHNHSLMTEERRARHDDLMARLRNQRLALEGEMARDRRDEDAFDLEPDDADWDIIDQEHEEPEVVFQGRRNAGTRSEGGRF